MLAYIMQMITIIKYFNFLKAQPFKNKYDKQHEDLIEKIEAAEKMFKNLQIEKQDLEKLNSNAIFRLYGHLKKDFEIIIQEVSFSSIFEIFFFIHATKTSTF